MLLTYEKAAANNSFEKDEIFKIYLKMDFNFNQLSNANEIYKSLPNQKARGLIYQSMLLSDNIEKKIYLAFLLKDLFTKDNIANVYSEEFLNILKSIKSEEIPDGYSELVKQYLDTGLKLKVRDRLSLVSISSGSNDCFIVQPSNLIPIRSVSFEIL